MPDEVFKQVPGSQLMPYRVELGDFTFPNEALGQMTLDESLDGNIVVKRATIRISPPAGATWDYHQQARVFIDDTLRLTGVCTRATPNQDGSITLEMAGVDWIMQQSQITSLGTFGMSPREISYWFLRIITPELTVEVEGLDLDQSLRPFMYAIPVKGLSSSGTGASLAINDSGIASHDWDQTFQPLLDNLEAAQDREYWQAETPKIFGIVFARDLMEAEAISLKRANTTLDIINFACSNGISHFATRYEEIPLAWDAQVAPAVSLYPCIIIREVQSVKGWVRELPGIQDMSRADLPECIPAIKLIAEKLSEVHNYGGAHDQKDETTLTRRQQKLLGGIQRALRWLTISSVEPDLADQFLAIWTALEAVLNSAEYPRVFSGPRAELRENVKKQLGEIPIPHTDNPLLAITADMLNRRVLQGDRSLLSKLQIFASSFGIQLNEDDVPTARRLYKVRSSALHSGTTTDNLTNNDVRYLQNLVRRLIMATTIGGYQDLESQVPKIQFGEVGPQGGAAPLFVDGQQVPYELTLQQSEDGQWIGEVITQGRLFNLDQTGDASTS